MKVFFVGDFKNDTGPSIANKMLRAGLQGNESMYYSDSTGKISRILELIVKTVKSDAICYCSSSKVNILGIRLAKLLKKKTFYIMHGYSSYEYGMNEIEVNESVLYSIKKYERFVFNNIDKVFCVSKKAMDFMIEAEPEYSDKFDYCFNGIDIKTISLNDDAILDKRQVISLGGGMKRKNNLAVCKAIQKLNIEHNMQLKYVVIGLPYTEKTTICSFDFVEYHDKLTNNDVHQKMLESYLYIQNSEFETFGIAPIEALLNGCNLLMSSKIGCIDIFKELGEEDIIFDTDSPDEIASKIKNIYNRENKDKLISKLQLDMIYNENTSATLIKKMVENIVVN